MVRLIPMKAVSDMTGRARSTLYEHMGDGLFVLPVKVGKRNLWPEDEVDAINRAVIAGASADELRELVARLHEARKQAVAA